MSSFNPHDNAETRPGYCTHCTGDSLFSFYDEAGGEKSLAQGCTARRVLGAGFEPSNLALQPYMEFLCSAGRGIILYRQRGLWGPGEQRAGCVGAILLGARSKPRISEDTQGPGGRVP